MVATPDLYLKNNSGEYTTNLYSIDDTSNPIESFADKTELKLLKNESNELSNEFKLNNFILNTNTGVDAGSTGSKQQNWKALLTHYNVAYEIIVVRRTTSTDPNTGESITTEVEIIIGKIWITYKISDVNYHGVGPYDSLQKLMEELTDEESILVRLLYEDENGSLSESTGDNRLVINNASGDGADAVTDGTKQILNIQDFINTWQGDPANQPPEGTTYSDTYSTKLVITNNLSSYKYNSENFTNEQVLERLDINVDYNKPVPTNGELIYNAVLKTPLSLDDRTVVLSDLELNPGGDLTWGNFNLINLKNLLNENSITITNSSTEPVNFSGSQNPYSIIYNIGFNIVNNNDQVVFNSIVYLNTEQSIATDVSVEVSKLLLDFDNAIVTSNAFGDTNINTGAYRIDVIVNQDIIDDTTPSRNDINILIEEYNIVEFLTARFPPLDNGKPSINFNFKVMSDSLLITNNTPYQIEQTDNTKIKQITIPNNSLLHLESSLKNGVATGLNVNTVYPVLTAIYSNKNPESYYANYYIEGNNITFSVTDGNLIDDTNDLIELQFKFFVYTTSDLTNDVILNPPLTIQNLIDSSVVELASSIRTIPINTVHSEKVRNIDDLLTFLTKNTNNYLVLNQILKTGDSWFPDFQYVYENNQNINAFIDNQEYVAETSKPNLRDICNQLLTFKRTNHHSYMNIKTIMELIKCYLFALLINQHKSICIDTREQGSSGKLRCNLLENSKLLGDPQNQDVDSYWDIHTMFVLLGISSQLDADTIDPNFMTLNQLFYEAHKNLTTDFVIQHRNTQYPNPNRNYIFTPKRLEQLSDNGSNYYTDVSDVITNYFRVEYPILQIGFGQKALGRVNNIYNKIVYIDTSNADTAKKYISDRMYNQLSKGTEYQLLSTYGSQGDGVKEIVNMGEKTAGQFTLHKKNIDMTQDYQCDITINIEGVTVTFGIYYMGDVAKIKYTFDAINYKLLINGVSITELDTHTFDSQDSVHSISIQSPENSDNAASIMIAWSSITIAWANANVPGNTLNTLYPICFTKDTPVVTDQGEIKIQEIQPGINTINGEEIIAISKTVHPDEYLVKIEKDDISEDVPSRQTIMSPQHKILYNGQLIKAYQHPAIQYPGKNMEKNEGQVLYNVLTKDYSTMRVNNMVVETLDPENRMALIYKCLQKASVKERNETLQKVAEYQKLSIKN